MKKQIKETKRPSVRYCAYTIEMFIYRYEHLVAPDDPKYSQTLKYVRKHITDEELDDIFSDSYPDEISKKVLAIAKRLRHKLGVNYAVAWLMVWVTTTFPNILDELKGTCIINPKLWETPGLLKYCKRVLNGKQGFYMYPQDAYDYEVPRRYKPNRDVYLILDAIQNEWDDCKDSIREECEEAGEPSTGSNYELCCENEVAWYDAEYDRYCNKYNIRRHLKY